mmetsp:Transcript_16674/g.25709  ORF Transcript_16674/g.25709 Transcript_16674/m.25709 type:complete len:82 (+) Transcript_16674:476-721(+)
MPNEIFLGKFLVIDIIPYTKIFREKLMTGKSVFSKVVAPVSKGGAQAKGKGSYNQSTSGFQASKVFEPNDIEASSNMLHSA